MPEKIQLNSVRTFSEIIEDSIQFFKQNWKPLFTAYFTICGFFWAGSFAVSLINVSAMLQHQEKHESVFTLTYFGAIGFQLLSYLIITLTILSFIALYKEKGNQPPTVAEVWSYIKYFFFRLSGSYILLIVLTIAGTFFCLVPGVYLAVVFSLTMPVMVMENSTFSYAFNRSFRLIKDNWWFTLGIAVVTEIIIIAAKFSIIIPVMVITWASSFLTTYSMMGVYSYTSVIVTNLFQFLYLLPLIAITLTYFSFTESKDDTTLLQRIAMIGQSRPNNTSETLTEEY